MALKAAIFLDKDGTLLADIPYNVDPRQMYFAPGACKGLKCLAALKRPLIVVSNQPGVALGLFRKDALHEVRLRLERMFALAGAELCDFYYCPHHPLGVLPAYAIACNCRKPAPGLLKTAAREHGIDLSASWFIGDILDDIEAGRRAGCRTLLLDNGNETEWRRGPLRTPDCVASDLEQACSIIAMASPGVSNSGLQEVI